MLLFNAFWIIVSLTKLLAEHWLTMLDLNDLGLDWSPYRSLWLQACVGSLVGRALPHETYI